EKLKKTYQHDHTVHKYVFELHKFWNLIGNVNKQDQVMKLWFGMNKYIQIEPWKDKLNPK
ncbi:hypothetical protein EV363DRAFT_1158023, partial [Boletus edulis]